MTSRELKTRLSECRIGRLISVHHLLLSKLYGLTAIAVTVLMAGTAANWMTWKPAVNSLRMQELPVQFVSPGNQVVINVPVDFDGNVMKVAYDTWLQDGNGRVTHKWPRVYADPKTRNALALTVPSVPAGEYTLHLTVYYQPNPIQTGEIQAEISHVYVASSYNAP